jgi:hypothetical protein
MTKQTKINKSKLKAITIKMLMHKLEQNIKCTDAEFIFEYEGQEYHAFYYIHTDQYGVKFWGCEVSRYNSHDDTISFHNVISWQYIKVKKQYN